MRCSDGGWPIQLGNRRRLLAVGGRVMTAAADAGVVATHAVELVVAAAAEQDVAARRRRSGCRARASPRSSRRWGRCGRRAQSATSGSSTAPPIVALTKVPLLRTRAKEALSLEPGPPSKRSPSQGWPPIRRSSPGPPIIVAGPLSLRGWKMLTP